MTGSHRATHRVFGNGWTMPAEVETLAEILQARGYRTIARVANPAVDVATGFAQGFDDFAIPAGLERAGPAMLEGAPLVAEVVEAIAHMGTEPVFLWAHLMDPHGPYFPPEEHRRRFAADGYRWPDDPPSLPIGTTNFGLGIIPRYQDVHGEVAPAAYRARYDAEVRYADDHVGAIVRALERAGVWERTLFVLTADHGESLGEHGYWFAHGWYVFDDQLRVPLLVHGPGVPAGRRVRQSVSLVDLAPTVLDLLGLPPSPRMEGASLRPLLGADGDDRDAFAQTYYGEGLVAYRSGTLKYVFKPSRAPAPRPASDPPFPDAGREWLFDLASDPRELASVADDSPDVLGRMRDRVQAWLADQERRGRGRSAAQARADGTPVSVLGDPQLERQLRALGYLE